MESFLENSRITKTLPEVNGKAGAGAERHREILQSILCSPGSLMPSPFLLQHLKFLSQETCVPQQDVQVGACYDLTARNSAQTTKSREGWSCKSRGAEMRTKERQFSDRSGTPNQHSLGQPCWRAGCWREFLVIS